MKPLTFPMDPRTLARFQAKYVVHPASGCWLWTGGVNHKGYGYFRNGSAHRVSFQHFIGPIPVGLEVDHVRARGCVHRHCVNPAHLEAVSHRENLARKESLAQRRVGHDGLVTHCLRGHEFTPENTLIVTKGRGGYTGRICGECARLRLQTKKKCPTCGSELVEKNLNRHRRKLHGAIFDGRPDLKGAPHV